MNNVTHPSESNMLTKGRTFEVTEIIGGYGPWQRNIFILLFLSTIPSAWHNLMISFVAPPDTDFWCTRPSNFSQMNTEKTGDYGWRNQSTGAIELLDQCEIVTFSLNSSKTMKCTAWEYNTSFYCNTIINEWNLVCDREWLVSLSMSIYNIGYMLALLICGQFSDSIGRRPVLLFCYVMTIVAGILSAFSTSFAVFVVLRFFTAFGGSGFYIITFVLLVEVVSPEHRPIIGISVNFGWCIAFASLPGVAWFIRDWFWLQIAVTLPKLLFFPVFWMVPESPRWLLTKGKTEEYQKILTKAAIINGRSKDWVLSEIDKLFLESEKVNGQAKTKEKNSNFLLLFKTPGLWKYSLNLFYCWLVNSFVYFGLTYNTENLAGNLYLNFFASGVVEFPSYICAIYVTKRMGRRIPMTIGMFAGGIAFALTMVVSVKNDLVWLKTAFSLVGKFFVAATFATIYVYTAEVYPTVVRSIAVGMGSAVARIASTVAPFLRELESTTNTSIINAAYAALSITSGLLILLMPETNNTKFKDSLDEVDMQRGGPEEENFCLDFL